MNEMLESVSTMLHIKKKSPIKLTIDILLNKYNFNAGETIEGKVFLETDKKILFTLKMKLVGTEAIFAIPNVNEKEIKNTIIDNNVNVLTNSSMKRGQAEIPFSIIIPFDAPPTLESVNNFKIEYALVVSLDLGGEKVLHSKKIFIHQMRNKDLPNTFVGKKASGKLIKGKESQILLRCVPSANFIVPGGDKYILNMSIKNNTSKLMPRILIRLEKIVKIKKSENISLVAEADCRDKVTKDSPFEQNVELELKNVNNMQPTCTQSKILNITYQVHFVCEFEDGKQWNCKMPAIVHSAAYPEAKVETVKTENNNSTRSIPGTQPLLTSSAYQSANLVNNPVQASFARNLNVQPSNKAVPPVLLDEKTSQILNERIDLPPPYGHPMYFGVNVFYTPPPYMDTTKHHYSSVPSMDLSSAQDTDVCPPYQPD